AVSLISVVDAFAGNIPPLNPSGPAASGAPYKAEMEGVELRMPQGWSYREEEDSLVLGSNTEAGLIVLWTSQVKAAGEIKGEFTQALANTGASFNACEGFASVALKSGQASFCEAAGVDQEGTALRARLVAVVGKSKTVLVGGLTTNEPAKFSVIQKRVDEIARSVKFLVQDPSKGPSVVVGQWWSYSGVSGVTGGGGGSERTMAFCPGGVFVEKSESGYYGPGWGTAGQGGGGGKWTAKGTNAAGIVTVTYGDGSTAEFEYAAKTPNDLSFNRRAYGRVEATLCR
ncbi:MAG: hypothetical protein AB1405_06460, partial [Bdellovibrionota bacterium]